MESWHLKFLVDDAEAEERFRFITKIFQADVNVAGVEVSEDSSEPEIRGLIISFREGLNKPANVTLQHYPQVYAVPPTIRKTRYEHLLSDFDIFEDPPPKDPSV